MIGYVTVGTNQFDKALQFYDGLFETIGIKRLWSHGNMAAWGGSRSEPAFCIAKPFDEKSATVGNGGMIALRMSSRAEVDDFYHKAISLGGTDEGKPGPRGNSGFYGAYFRDLDGNKLNAYIPG